MSFDLDQMTAQITAIKQADDVESLRAQVIEAMGLVGIRHAYFLAPLTADPRIGRILFNTGLSPVWVRHYRKQLHLCDPLPGLSLESDGVFAWPEEIAADKLGERKRRYLKVAARFGLGRGVGIACYGPHGRSGFLGCGWPHNRAVTEAERLLIYAVGQASFHRYCRLVRNEEPVPTLSRRELQVLSWMCVGKSNPVIAQLLDVSRSSVDVYVRRIFAKLDVTDRTAACIRAYSLGLTVTGDYQRLVRDTAERRAEHFAERMIEPEE